MRRFAFVFLAMLAWIAIRLPGHALGAEAPAAARQAHRQANVVLIVIDDLGWADLGCYGSKYYRTPNLDRLAAEGMRFTQAYAACPVCSPTRTALMTGKYPARVHLTDYIPGFDRVKTRRLAGPDRRAAARGRLCDRINRQVAPGWRRLWSRQPGVRHRARRRGRGLGAQPLCSLPHAR